MARVRGIAVALALVALAGAAIGAGTAPAPAAKPAAKPAAAAPAKLPEGPGYNAIVSSCLICHSSMLIQQQHKDATAWEKSVVLMEKWGAPVRATEHAEVIAYLVEHFGPAKPAPSPPKP